jgi:hypothetical protein
MYAFFGDLRDEALVEVLEPRSTLRRSLLWSTTFLLHVEILFWSHEELAVLIIKVLLLRRRLLLNVLLDFGELKNKRFRNWFHHFDEIQIYLFLQFILVFDATTFLGVSEFDLFLQAA